MNTILSNLCLKIWMKQYAKESKRYGEGGNKIIKYSVV